MSPALQPSEIGRGLAGRARSRYGKNGWVLALVWLNKTPCAPLPTSRLPAPFAVAGAVVGSPSSPNKKTSKDCAAPCIWCRRHFIFLDEPEKACPNNHSLLRAPLAASTPFPGVDPSRRLSLPLRRPRTTSSKTVVFGSIFCRAARCLLQYL